MAAPISSGIIRSITARCFTAAIGTEDRSIIAMTMETFGFGSAATGITTSGTARARTGLAQIVSVRR